ncbi:MAG TPA: AsmA-like C-terminal region-containing protein [Gemmatimonadaceae bacterium]|nr:AsmA-like C-terminal region-containing protein [Gemmatimonadaceae bacterium]
MKRALLTLGIIVIVLVALLFVALTALESRAGKDRIASALASTLHQPVTIGTMSVSLFPTPALDASGIRVGGADSAAAPGVAIASLRVVPDLASLLPGHTLTVRSIDLVGLVVSVRRTAAGRWLVPVPPVGAAPNSAAGGASSGGLVLDRLRIERGALRVVDDSLRAPSGAPTITTITGLEAQMRADSTGLTVPSFRGQLGLTAVSGAAQAGARGITFHLASASIDNHDLASLFALAGMQPYPGLAIAGKAPVDMTTTIAPDLATITVTGTASVERLTFGTITLTTVATPFRYAHNVLTLDPMTFAVYGGAEKGAVTVDLTSKTPAFAMKTAITGLDVNQALSANTTMKNQLQGTGALSATVRGSGTTQAAVERTLAGTVTFALANGSVHNFPILDAIDKALSLTGTSSPELAFQKLSGSATLGGGVAHVTDLALLTPDLTLAGTGTYGLTDDSLDFHVLAHLSAARSGQVVQRVSQASRLENAQGQIELPVTIGATAGAPRFGVDVKSVATKQLKTELQNQVTKQLQKTNVPGGLTDKLKGLFQKSDTAKKDTSPSRKPSPNERGGKTIGSVLR